MQAVRLFRVAAAVAPRITAMHTISRTTLPACHAVFRGFAQQAPTEGISTEPLAEEKPGAETEKSADKAAEESPVAQLQRENEQLKKSVSELNTTRLRLLAEMENVRTIAKRDVDLAKAYALQSFGKRLLDVVDNLGRAVESVPEESRSKAASPVLGNLYEGVSATHRSMLKTLGEFGINAFGEKGEKFDPNRHEAMMQVPASAEVKADHVALVLKTGFTLKERVLRPAQVAVAIDSSNSQ